MKNRCANLGETTEVYIKNKDTIHTVLIDTEDLEKIDIGNITWHVRDRGKHIYALTTKRQGKKFKFYSMHRLIMDAPEEKIIDHINHNTLDNRKSNMRVVTTAENAQNRNSPNGKSGVMSVAWHKKCNKWQVALKINGKNRYFGLFEDLEEAAVVAREAREKYLPYSYEATARRITQT